MLCRSCRTPLGEPVLDLGESPIANAYRRPEDLSPELRFPLRLMVCPKCFLVQVDDVLPREAHFHADYAYLSAASSSWRAHVQGYAGRMVADLGLDAGSTVVEIGSNDGALAGSFAAAGVRTIGVDPAAHAAAFARERGVETVVGFFGRDMAQRLRDEGVRADLMCANNVLAHVPDLDDFVGGFALLLADRGHATFEFPLVSIMLRDGLYDTIYHEHFSYLSLTALAPLFARHGLEFVDAELLATHGGSARLHVGRAGAGAITGAVAALLAEERAAGLTDMAVYRGFAGRVQLHRQALRHFVRDIKAGGATIAGYGAPAKAATLLSVCEVGAECIDYVVDRAPTKQGRLLPGVGIPIRPPEALRATPPDVVLILAWNLAAEIIGELADLKAAGVRFATPMPQPGFL
jgi:C-methyltransferase C-terminal domain/Putative zinc binding domain/Methyltransferase domain